MSPFNIHKGVSLSRRKFLRNAGIVMGLPMLDAMTPAFAAAPMASPKRFVGVSLSLGLHGPNLVPRTAGKDYKPSPYLQSLQDIREHFTVVSGASHPGVNGGHTAEASIFSACPRQRGGGSRNTISIDQLMAKHFGHETRFPSLVLNTRTETSPSYTENGAMIPAVNDPRKLFAQLFIEDSPEARRRQNELIHSGKSVMDIIGQEAKALEREVGAGDREKLDAWFTSVRELEKRLQMNEAWVGKPKPNVGTPPKPADRSNAADEMRAMLDVVFLALETDSTRFVTLHCTGNAVRGLEGVDESYHSLSHHGRDEDKLEQLTIVEQAMIDGWAGFLRRLKGSNHNQGTLLDDTTSIMTSNLGNASSHDNRNMPVLVGGGAFHHGQHLAFNTKNNYPLPNLYLSALRSVGIVQDSFATSTGQMKGLELKS
jgi:hypothetical protein